MLDCKGVSRSTLPPVFALISGALSPATFFRFPRGLTEVHTQQLSPVALDSPFLSASRLGVSVPHLSKHNTQQDRIKREGGGVKGGRRKVYCVSAAFCKINGNPSASKECVHNMIIS